MYCCFCCLCFFLFWYVVLKLTIFVWENYSVYWAIVINCMYWLHTASVCVCVWILYTFALLSNHIRMSEQRKTIWYVYVSEQEVDFCSRKYQQQQQKTKIKCMLMLTYTHTHAHTFCKCFFQFSVCIYLLFNNNTKFIAQYNYLFSIRFSFIF